MAPAKKRKRPSQASGLAAGPSKAQRRSSGKRPYSKGVKKAKNLGNALLPGNPFG